MSNRSINVRQHLRSWFRFDFESLNNGNKCESVGLSLGLDCLQDEVAEVDDICNYWLILRILVIDFSEFGVCFADELYIFVWEAAGRSLLIGFFEHRL